jgi:replicative DNA helicase
VASSAHIQFHARIIAEKFIKRELIRVSSEIIRDSFDETKDVFELLNAAEQNLFSIAEKNMSKQVATMTSVVREAIQEIEKYLSYINTQETVLNKIESQTNEYKQYFQ